MVGTDPWISRSGFSGCILELIWVDLSMSRKHSLNGQSKVAAPAVLTEAPTPLALLLP